MENLPGKDQKNNYFDQHLESLLKLKINYHTVGFILNSPNEFVLSDMTKSTKAYLNNTVYNERGLAKISRRIERPEHHKISVIQWVSLYPSFILLKKIYQDDTVHNWLRLFEYFPSQRFHFDLEKCRFRRHPGQMISKVASTCSPKAKFRNFWSHF